MKKLIISIISFVLFLIGLLSTSDGFVSVVELADEYLAIPQNVTTVIDYSARIVTRFIYGPVISTSILVTVGAFICAFICVIERL